MKGQESATSVLLVNSEGSVVGKDVNKRQSTEQPTSLSCCGTSLGSPRFFSTTIFSIANISSNIDTDPDPPLPLVATSSQIQRYRMVPKPQGTTTVKSVTHRPLPPLPKLRVRRPNKPETNPCLGVMASVLGCWASSGYSVQGCAQFEQKLRQCMDAPVCCIGNSELRSHRRLMLSQRNQDQRKNNINYHLSRMYPNIIGPHKRN